MDDQSAEKRTASNDDERYEAFMRLLVEHAPRVRSFLRGLLPTWHDVEEVTQEASLWNALHISPVQPPQC